MCLLHELIPFIDWMGLDSKEKKKSSSYCWVKLLFLFFRLKKKKLKKKKKLEWGEEEKNPVGLSLGLVFILN